MSDVAHPVMSQKPFVSVIAALALTVLTIGGARMMGFTSFTPYSSDNATEQRTLKFEDAAQGTVLVRDAKSGALIADFGIGEGAFLRATLRALVNDRRHKGTSIEGDFRLERTSGGQLYLIDEVTGKALALNAYGPANAAVFAAFMFNPKGEAQ